ncbi:phosphotransferase [Nonomuraea sp. NPDC050790]|uniref:phosphotransferase n=1 Tax=Nonomuraea sp. NPDC050790 TaxID=3364371 RepID=UPI0037A33BEB
MLIETAERVAREYELGEVTAAPVYAARGELGRIWRVDTGRGSWAVKESLIEVAEPDAAADVAFQRAAAAAGVELPAPVLDRRGRVILRARPYDLRVYEWADLAPGEITAAQLGAATADVHRVRHAARGPVPAWFADPLGPQGWAGVAEISRGQEWEDALRAWLDDLVAVEAVVVPPDPARVTTCHRDLNEENLRVSAAGRVTVLDWENCGPAVPAWELAAIVARDPEVYRAYVAAGGPARVTGPEDFSMRVAVQGHLLEFYARRAADPAEGAENRARSRARLEVMLTRPLTLERISAVLEGLRDHHAHPVGHHAQPDGGA